MAYHVSVVPATSGTVSVANNDTLLDLYINETVGGVHLSKY